MHLFDPQQLSATLDDYPAIASRLQDPVKIGQAALHCPGLRRSRREVVRLLANTHYGHVRDLLAALDELSAVRLVSDRVYRTSGLSQFRGDHTEIATAYALHRAGAHLTPLDVDKGRSPVADFEVEKGGRTACIEIYCPRTWEAISIIQSEMQSTVKNLDHPASFVADIDIQAAPGLITTAGTLDATAAALTGPSGKALVSDLSTRLIMALDGTGPRRFTLQEKESGMRVSLDVHSVLPSTGMPVRRVSFAGHEIGGYAAEGIFARALDGGIAKKLRAGQALQRAGLPGVLIVEISSMQLDYEWDSPLYLDMFREQVASPAFDLNGHAAVVFARARGRGTPLEILLSKTDAAFALEGLLN